MKNKTRFFLILLAVNGVYAQTNQQTSIVPVSPRVCSERFNTAEDSFTEAMENALQLFRDANTVEEQQKSLDELIKVTERHKNEWIAFYWTAHVYGQTGRLYNSDNDKFKAYLDKAQEYLAQAWKHNKNQSNMDKSELHTLQCLLYRLGSFAYFDPRRDVNRSKAKADKLISLAIASLKEAERENPDNPRVHLQKGITLVYNKQYKRGIATLERAIELYEEFIGKSSIHPDWGRNWIDVWLPRAQKLAKAENELR